MNRPATAARVLLVDDDEGLNALLTEYLGQFGFVVRAVTHPEEGLRALKADPPDILILDVMLPAMDGFAVCRKVRETSRVPIVMLTARGEVMDRVVGLELGADDYLPKPFEPRELVARMQAVLRRGAPPEPLDTLRAGSLELSWAARSARLEGRLLDLTTAEFELLGLLLRNRGRVLTRERILDQTRGLDWEAYDRSIWLLLAFVAGVVLAAYAVLRRALRPLRSLREGVGRLAEGDLDVALPNRTRDEFGALTEAFNQMVGRVREMVQAREQLLLDVSHELRSPLTRMKVALALLPDGEKEQRMGADVAEMEAMISELLELEPAENNAGRGATFVLTLRRPSYPEGGSRNRQ